MKKGFRFLFLILSVLSLSSCLKGGLEDLPVYEDADITSVSAVRYRYITDEKSPASGEYIVKEVDLSYDAEINEKDCSVKIKVTVPSEFPSEELEKLSTSNLLVVVSISTAARMFPEGGSPALGIPGNWSKPNTYIVQAANGDKKKWTIEVVSLYR